MSYTMKASAEVVDLPYGLAYRRKAVELVKCERTGNEAAIWSIDGSGEKFNHYWEAVVAACARKHRVKHSIAIYRNGEVYDLKRY